MTLQERQPGRIASCATTSIPSAELQGDTEPGYLVRPVARLDGRRSPTQTLPKGMGFEWTELAFEQQQAGNTGVLVFGLAVVFVFLLLAAQLREPRAAAGGDPDRADVPARRDPRRESDGHGQ